MAEPSLSFIMSYLEDAEWEKAKGHLMAMLALHHCDNNAQYEENWKPLNAYIESFIKAIEEGSYLDDSGDV